MIGSSTFIVKNDNKFYVHILGGCYFPEFMKLEAAKKKQSLFVFLSKSLNKYRNNPNVTVDEEEAIKIADARQCVNQSEPGYHKLAGDGRFLVDEDAKQVLRRCNGEWIEL